jgi:FkbM family methyltransferase
MVDPRVVAAKYAEMAFYRRTLVGFRRGDLIFDVGANEGHKTDVFLRLGARVVAVDPDPYNVDVLRRSFLTYRMKRCPVEIVDKAVSDVNAVASMWVDAPGSAKNTLSSKWAETLRTDDHRFGSRLEFATQRDVETVVLHDLFTAYGVPFFVKIDVEGHEIAVLRGLRHPVPYLSFEVNLPEFAAEGRECIQRLKHLAPQGTFNYTADCAHGLALNQWLDERNFLCIFNACTEKSVEVFWRTDY